MSDFGELPPEINSARMYAGPGSGPLLASAAAWDALAAQLETFGAQYSSTISTLHGDNWSGATSIAMTAAAEPYLAWVMTTAGQAAESASQTRAAAAAYEAAFAATVPPAVVLANRTLMATLVATNWFGQNTPAIATTETDYAEMWAQDATAMYGYAVSSSAAAALTSFSQPPQTTNPAWQSTQSNAVGQALQATTSHAHSTLSQLMSAVSQRLQALMTGPFTSPETMPASSMPTLMTTSAATASTPLFTAVTDLDVLDASTILSFAIPKTVFQGGSFALAFSRTGDQAAALPALSGPAAGEAGTAQTRSAAQLPGSVLASVGRAAPVGGLSVPPSWTASSSEVVPISETTDAAKTPFRALPSWASPTNAPSVGRLTTTESRRSNAVFRMRDRRYRIPRPTLGG